MNIAGFFKDLYIFLAYTTVLARQLLHDQNNLIRNILSPTPLAFKMKPRVVRSGPVAITLSTLRPCAQFVTIQPIKQPYSKAITEQPVEASTLKPSCYPSEVPSIGSSNLPTCMYCWVKFFLSQWRFPQQTSNLTGYHVWSRRARQHQ